jgi:hypothetical protein
MSDRAERAGREGAPSSGAGDAPGLARARAVDGLAALAIGAAYTVLLFATVGELGYARDEGFYVEAARGIERWFVMLRARPAAALARSIVDSAWAANHEHPALMKSLMALSHLALPGALHRLAPEGASWRLPAMALAGALLGAVYLYAARRWGRAAGAVAALSLGFMPRFYFHAHLACLDVPVAATFTFTALAWLRSLRARGWAWPVASGLLFGLALDTKHNAVLVPFACAAHLGLAAALGRLAGERVAPLVRRGLVTLGAMCAVGPLTLIALWPWLWHDTAARLVEWAAFHWNHEYYNMELLGVNYWRPPMPRAYAWLMTAATVPTVTLVLCAAGVGASALAGARRLGVPRAEDRDGCPPALREDLFLALCIIVSYAPWLSTRTPIFGGTKHWLSAYPFVALYAGSALSQAVRAQAAWPGRGAVGAVLASLCAVAAPLAESLHAHPWGLSAYVPLVGGAPGAATLGLNRGFWGYTTGSIAPWLDRALEPRAHVYVHDTAPGAWRLLAEDGRLRRDLVPVPRLDEADASLYHHELHMQGEEYQAWDAFGTVAPVEIEGLDGVPVISVYRRSAAGRAR